MAFLEKLRGFGVSESQIKELFAQHFGKEESSHEVQIIEKLVDLDGYSSDIKSLLVLIPKGLRDGLGTMKVANFLIKTDMGKFWEKVLDFYLPVCSSSKRKDKTL